MVDTRFPGMEEYAKIHSNETKSTHLTCLKKRLPWDDYYMALALVSACRSPDPSTKHGAVLVDELNRVISIGYNGYVRGSNDEIMPNTRPEKYGFILHAEENAILNASRDLKNSTLYISGIPCGHCWLLIAQVGIKRVIYGPIGSLAKSDGSLASNPAAENNESSECIENLSVTNEIPQSTYDLVLKDRDILVEQYQGDVVMTLWDVVTYIQSKEVS